MPDIKISNVAGMDFGKILDQLANAIDPLFFDQNTSDYLKEYINPQCTDVTIEFPYYDLEYLSSVYTYYVKATKPTKRECYRLHFYIKDDYMGYIVLRPTPQMHIGRIQASPRLFLRNKAFLITQEYRSSILGDEKFVNCFQFMKQDPEVAMCAQVATWAVVEHGTRSNKNVICRKIAEITDMTWTFPERKIPAKGLTAQNIMEVLTSSGLFPVALGNTNSSIDKNEVLAYLESGIPIIGFIRRDRHAVCLVGHGRLAEFSNEEQMQEFCIQNQEMFTNQNGEVIKSNFVLSSRFIDRVIVNDDNYAPYLEMPLDIQLKSNKRDSKEKKYGSTRISYSMAKMDGFIIPLSEKIYLSYQDVYKTATSYILSNRSDFPELMVMRIFLSDSPSFKAHALNNISDVLLSETICKLCMSMYVWCVELSTPNSYMQGKVDCMFIYDSTRHSRDLKPWLLVQTLSAITHFNGEEFSDPEQAQISAYNQFRSNLEEY